jgi:hypothetical protein
VGVSGLDDHSIVLRHGGIENWHLVTTDSDPWRAFNTFSRSFILRGAVKTAGGPVLRGISISGELELILNDFNC